MIFLPDDWTRVEATTFANDAAMFAQVAVVLVILLLSVIAFRGR